MAPLIMLAAAAAGGPQAAPIPSFIAGCWQLVSGPHWTDECWMEPKAGMMLGASREGTGKRLESWEWMSIERAADGIVTFYASPGGHQRTPFKLDQVSPTSVRFVNSDHDYPQVIRYEISGGRLKAAISRLDGSRTIRWTYRRVR